MTNNTLQISKNITHRNSQHVEFLILNIDSDIYWEEKQIKKEPTTPTWKEVLKGSTHWIVVVLCIIILIL